MVVLLYITPVFVSWSQDPHPEHFQDGHFASLAGRLGGQVLVVAMVVGSIISNVGQLNANSMAGQRISHHIMTTLFPSVFEQQQEALASRGVWSRIVYKTCVVIDGTGVPVAFILVSSGRGVTCDV
jgi:hypothetical protein